jgi:DinB superfamily
MESNFKDDLKDVVLTAFGEFHVISEDAASSGTESEWSIKEIVGHLIDSATNNHQRFIRLQAETEVNFPFYNQEIFVKYNHYQSQNWLQVLELWKNYNLHLAHIIEKIEPNKLNNVWITPNGEKLELGFIIKDYLRHVKHHIKQIKSKSLDR